MFQFVFAMQLKFLVFGVCWPLWYWIDFWKNKNIFVFIILNTEMVGHWNPHLWKSSPISCLFNAMVADGLVMQGANWGIGVHGIDLVLPEHGLTLIPAWISNHMPGNVWDKTTYPFLNFNCATVEV